VNAVKVVLLLAGAYLSCAVLAIITSFATIAATEKAGPTATGNTMIVALGILAVLFLLTLPVVFWGMGRWVEALLFRVLLTAGYGLLLIATWLLAAFFLVIVLNR
jgi:hypothetical protein